MGKQVKEDTRSIMERDYVWARRKLEDAQSKHDVKDQIYWLQVLMLFMRQRLQHEWSYLHGEPQKRS